MEFFQEPIHYQNAALCLKVWQFTSIPRLQPAPMQDISWHYHKEVEFLSIQQGVHEIATPNRTYTLKAGDVMVIGSSQLHRGRVIGPDPLVYIVFHVDLEPYFDPAMMRYYRWFSEVLQPLEELNYIFEEDAATRAEVARIVESIHAEVLGEAKGYEIAASMHIKHLLLTLLRGDTRGLLQAHERVDAYALKPIVEYVDRHLAEKLDMEQAARQAGMSYHYFSRYFKRAMGASFTDYVNRKRIAKAERLLATSGRSIAEVASEVGIGNMAHFYELFKRFNGCTPKQYARSLKAEKGD